MEIGVLSRNRHYFSTREIISSLTRKGMTPVYVDTPKVQLTLTQDEVTIRCNHRDLGNLDAVIPRIGRSLTEFGAMILNHFAILQVPTTLSSDALVTARNKFRALQTLATRGVPIPPTRLIASRVPSSVLARELPYPIVIKLLSGTHGIGVMRVMENLDVAQIIDTLCELNQPVCLQKYLDNPGEDIRAFIVDSQVVATMKRVAPPGEWRSNIHLGAKAVPYTLGPDEEELAIQAAEAIHAGVAGVDLISTPEGLYVIEVNASPGFRGLMSVSGVNVADAIVDYAIRLGKK
jgi:ribosomal protein S6--L-glutamate ligase